MLLKRDCLLDEMLHEQAVTQLTHILGDLEQEISLNKTRKFWTEYVQMVPTLLLIRAECTGYCELNSFCVARMIPIHHSGGHTAYAKSALLKFGSSKRVVQTRG